MSVKPLVSCLTCTYGRYTWLKEAIQCFLLQDYDERELIILNNHPVAINLDLPRVRVINEPGHPTLGDCRNRLLQEAKGDFVRTWDDDDLYLPWAISQGVENMGSYAAFKPRYSWFSRRNSVYTKNENVYEASWTARTDAVRRYGYKGQSGGDEHTPLSIGLEREGFLVKDVRPSYVYRWDTPLWRISGSLGSDTVENRTAIWMKQNDDHGSGEPLVPGFRKDYFSQIEREERGKQ